MDKILTIIVPTYNMEKYLDKCLSSLIFPDVDLMRQLEVLVVNDGSKDRSSEIAHGYAERYPETYVVIDKENGNYGSCINVALPMAKGKYVKVLDADDWFEPETLSMYLTYLSDCCTDVVINRCMVVDETGTDRYEKTIDPRLIDLQVFDIEDFAIDRESCDISMHCIAYRKEIFGRFSYRQTEGISYTDMEWVFKPMAYCNSFTVFNKILYKYLVGREGQTINQAALSKRFFDVKKVSVSLVQYLREFTGDDKHRRYLGFRLHTHLNIIYENAIVYRIYNNQQLRILDSEIRNLHPKFFELMNFWLYQYTQPCRYIAYWRRGLFALFPIILEKPVDAIKEMLFARSIHALNLA